MKLKMAGRRPAPPLLSIVPSIIALIWAVSPPADGQQKQGKSTAPSAVQSKALPPPVKVSLPPPPNELILQPGDKIVWLGDSITAMQMYGRYVEAFLLLRRPDLELSFVNA